jgi:hypothetical protein
MTSSGEPQTIGSLRLHVRLANDAAVLVILSANKRAEIRAALPDRKQALSNQLPPGFGFSQCRSEPAGDFRDHFLSGFWQEPPLRPTGPLVILAASQTVRPRSAASAARAWSMWHQSIPLRRRAGLRRCRRCRSRQLDHIAALQCLRRAVDHPILRIKAGRHLDGVTEIPAELDRL